ncbi:MAG: bifunctional DNA-formamidopyrimidine glycosylase/DNA-(apurinic or apyrimidinic site) lyase, partial [Gemmataceae bacterium]
GLFLVIHLGMTGQLQVKPSSQSPADHTHLIFHLEPGTDQLHFRDIRRFGSAQVFTGRDDLHRFFDGGRLGPEPFGLDPTRWRDSLKKSTRAIKAVLLDQGVVAGVGNIYADESLFLSRIHPASRSCDLSPKEAETLRRAIEEVLTFAIEKRGSTIRNYVGGSGLSGGYQDEFRAYGRGGEPCNRCATPIEVMRLAGRASHFCPRCQKVKPGRSPCSSRKS